jgi:hypothetical protein
VIHDGRSGVVARPALISAIVGKWRVFAQTVDDRRDPDRHLRDAARLLTVVDPPTPSHRRWGSSSAFDDCSPRLKRDLNWRTETTTSSSTRSSC